MEDRRAHERIDGLEKMVKEHLATHVKFEKALSENTALTKKIADNTTEIIALVKSAKTLRHFVVWVAPMVAAAIAVWEWFRAHKWL